MEKEYVACLQISWSAYDFWITFFEKDLDHNISDLCRNNSKFSLFVVFSVRRSIEYRSLVKWNLRFHIKMWAVCSFVGLQRLASCNALFVCCCFVLPFKHLENCYILIWKQNAKITFIKCLESNLLPQNGQLKNKIEANVFGERMFWNVNMLCVLEIFKWDLNPNGAK